MTELQGHEDRLEISANSGVFVRSREKGSHGRSRVGGSAPPLCQRAGCYQSHLWDLQAGPLRRLEAMMAADNLETILKTPHKRPFGLAAPRQPLVYPRPNLSPPR